MDNTRHPAILIYETNQIRVENIPAKIPAINQAAVGPDIKEIFAKITQGVPGLGSNVIFGFSGCCFDHGAIADI